MHRQRAFHSTRYRSYYSSGKMRSFRANAHFRARPHRAGPAGKSFTLSHDFPGASRLTCASNKLLPHYRIGDFLDCFCWAVVNINSSLSRKRLPAADAPRESESEHYHTLLGELPESLFLRNNLVGELCARLRWPTFAHTRPRLSAMAF